MVNQTQFPTLTNYCVDATSSDTIEYNIGEILSEITNEFQSGYSLRDVLEIVDGLELNTQEAKHELSDPAKGAWAIQAATGANTPRHAR